MQLRNCCLSDALVLARMRGQTERAIEDRILRRTLPYLTLLLLPLCSFLPCLVSCSFLSKTDGELYGQGNSFSPCCFWLLQKKAKEDRPLNEYSVPVFQKGEKSHKSIIKI